MLLDPFLDILQMRQADHHYHGAEAGYTVRLSEL